MSDDDRMDRAERIRKMREGNRAEADDDPTEAASTDADSDAAAETDTTAAGSTASTGEAEAQSVDGAETEAGDGEPPAEEAETTTAGADESDAMAAAQRAAQAALEVTGDDTDQAAETTGTPQQPADASAAATPMQGATGVELPDQALLDEAMANSAADETTGSAGAAAMEEQESQSEELVRVLEFALGDEYYCLDIEYVEEIVKREDVTRVPNTDEYVEGVVDLRGQITTILDPKEMMDIDAGGEKNLVVVFDPETFGEQGAVGWIVDEVRQVAPVTEDEVNSPPVDASYINGVVDREDREQFVIWVEPDDALEAAISEDDD
jgi:purine-binding chemotaxis protein CheW